MTNENKIPRKKDARELIAKSSLVIGQLAKDPKEGINLLAQTVAGMVRGQGFETLKSVFDNLASKGEIDKEFLKSNKGAYFIQEINYTLEHESKDMEDVVYKIKLFIAIASNKYRGNSFDEAKEVWAMVKLLDTLAIKVLATAYTKALKDNPQTNRLETSDGWVALMAKESGLKYDEFADKARQQLSGQRLLSVNPDINYMLSPLGMCVAGYLHEGHRLFDLAE